MGIEPARGTDNYTCAVSRMLFFNVSHGYLEGIVRGFKSGLITSNHYNNFCQCETVEDLKVQLTAGSDYGTLLESLTGTIKPSTLNAKFREKFVQDFRYLRCNASGNLAKFLDYITYEYMIGNVVMIMMGLSRGEELDREELIKRCHPLGMVDLMPALTVSRNLSDLYTTVLVETPIGPYFKSLLTNLKFTGELTELNVELVRMALWKAYLEDFEQWCQEELDDVSGRTMHEILSFEADRRTISIAVNSIGTSLAKEIRLQLFPKLGKLSDWGLLEKLAYADDPSQIRQPIDLLIPEYRSLIDAAISGKTGDDSLFQSRTPFDLNSSAASFEVLATEREVALCKDAFFNQFTMTPFYAWCKLAEQERRNLVWIAECIAQGQKEKTHQFVQIF